MFIPPKTLLRPSAQWKHRQLTGERLEQAMGLFRIIQASDFEMCRIQVWRERSSQGISGPGTWEGTDGLLGPLDTAPHLTPTHPHTHTYIHTVHNNRLKIAEPVVAGVRLVDSRKVVSRDAHRLPSDLPAAGTKGSFLAGPVCGSIAVLTTGCGKIGWGVPRG